MVKSSMGLGGYNTAVVIAEPDADADDQPAPGMSLLGPGRGPPGPGGPATRGWPWGQRLKINCRIAPIPRVYGHDEQLR